MRGFIKSPNLPQRKVSLVAIDGRVRKTILDSLEDMGIHAILTYECEGLYNAVSYHPDMFIHHLGENCIVAAPNAPEAFIDKLQSYGFYIIRGQKSITGKYPDDIAYNVARIGDYAVCNTAYSDVTLLKCLHERGVKIVDVKQGYSKCSLSIIDSNTAITSDEGLYAALSKHGFDVLKINPGSIDLPGLNYGFIGGATGLISKDTIAFAGNIALHPDFEKIKEFLSQHGKHEKVLDSKKLLDVGTIIPLKEYCIEEIC